MSFLPCPHCDRGGQRAPARGLRQRWRRPGRGDPVPALRLRRPGARPDPARRRAARGRRRRQADRRGRPDRPGRAWSSPTSPAGCPVGSADSPGCSSGSPPPAGPESPRPVFGVGLAEMAFIAFIAILVFGPDRLPDLAKQAGQMVRKARAVRQRRPRRAPRRARPRVRRPRAARPRPAHDRAQAHHRGHGGRRGGRQAEAARAPPSRRRRAAAVRRGSDLTPADPSLPARDRTLTRHFRHATGR